MRDTPVIVFVNKLDREGKDPYDLLDELEVKLNIQVQPLTWPINMGPRFKGVYNLYKKELNLFSANKTKIEDQVLRFDDLNKPELNEVLGQDDANQLREDEQLLQGLRPF